MKKIVLLISVFVISTIVVFISISFRTVYFVDGSTGDITKLTSLWIKQNEIEIKDRWFTDFDNGYISGVIIIEDSEEYAYIPYSYTKMDSEGDLPEFYKNELSRVKAVVWVKKDNKEDISISFKNEQKLDVAVGTYSGTAYDTTQYGMGIYSIPLFKSNGDIFYHLQFAVSGVVGLRDGFNEGVPTYILQEVIYSEVNINEEITLLIPIYFVGGVSSADINGSTHYLFEYNGQQIILEAEFIPIP